MAKTIFVKGAISAEFIGNSIAKHQSKTSIGAHQLFLGQVRADEIDGTAVEAIEYTSYEDMANEKMLEIREDIFANNSITCMHVYHSLGQVKTGEICLFVFVSSPHRAESQEVCKELVERVKKDLPIWGKELTAENEQWKVNQ